MRECSAPPIREAPALRRGADGWRAVIGEGFSIEAVAALAEATGHELIARSGCGRVFVAHDSRLQSKPAAHAAAAALGMTAVV